MTLIIPCTVLSIVGYSIFKSISDFPQRLSQVPEADKMRALTVISAQARNDISYGSMYATMGGAAITAGLLLGVGIAISHKPSRSDVLAYGLLAAALIVAGTVAAGLGLNGIAGGATDYVQANQALSDLAVAGM